MPTKSSSHEELNGAGLKEEVCEWDLKTSLQKGEKAIIKHGRVGIGVVFYVSCIPKVFHGSKD